MIFYNISFIYIMKFVTMDENVTVHSLLFSPFVLYFAAVPWFYRISLAAPRHNVFCMLSLFIRKII